MVPATENGLSAEAVYQADRQLPREGRIMLIDRLASRLREGESLDAEAGTANSSSLVELDQERRTKYQWP